MRNVIGETGMDLCDFSAKWDHRFQHGSKMRTIRQLREQKKVSELLERDFAGRLWERLAVLPIGKDDVGLICSMERPQNAFGIISTIHARNLCQDAAPTRAQTLREIRLQSGPSFHAAAREKFLTPAASHDGEDSRAEPKEPSLNVVA